MFWLLAASRILGALLAPIPDCDEVFNYWEPVHFLVHGRGQQTWEYSPEFALRSYWYILLHAGPTYLLSLLTVDRVLQFRLMRVALALFGAKCQHFCWSRVKRIYDREEKKTAKAVLVLNMGLFLATHTFLPSTFSMNMLLLALGCFMDYAKTPSNWKLALSLLACAYGIGVAWPFCAVLIVLFLFPFAHKAASTLFSLKFIALGLVAVAAALVPSVLADTHYYGRPVLGIWNLLIYNTSFGKGNMAGSSLLYGVEPWHYYLRNLLLNFNLVFVGFLVYPALLAYRIFTSAERHKWVKLGFVSVGFGWLVLMSLQPHKVSTKQEERFMYLIYPVLCLLGAETITSLKKVSEVLFRITLVAVVLVSLSTCVQHVRSYGAPQMVWSQPMSGRICVGREWYRFPSSFFLSDNATLAYFEDGIKDQLPQPFVSTRDIPTNMNDQNREEKSRYVPLDTCDYVIDVNLTSSPLRRELRDWVITIQIPQKSILFLDRDATPQPFRSIYVPVLRDGYYTLVHYLALKNPAR